MILNIYTDGASRNNPGESASGYLVMDDDNNVLLQKSFYNGIRTNNEAEYLAIIAALEAAAHEYGYDNDIMLFSDSKLAVSQLNGDFKIKSPALKKLNSDALTLFGKFRSHRLTNVPREHVHITEVDADLNRLLDRQEKGYK